MLEKWFKFKARKGSEKRPDAPSYQECKEILLKGTDAQKVELARSKGVQPEILYFLSSDKSWRVRCAVAQNPDTPIQADVILSEDKEVRVRLALSEKVAQLLPELRPEQNEKVTEMAFEIMKKLAVDQDKEVRFTLAKAASALGTIPKSIAMTLAEDTDDNVAMPILEFSELLDDEDLERLILGGLANARLSAVARRNALSENLSETIVRTEDSTAISSLLSNPSANITDGTFDILLDDANVNPNLLDMIAVRDVVSESTLLKLARMASGALLERIKQRENLGADLTREISIRIKSKQAEAVEHAPQTDEERIEEEIERLYQEGSLTTERVMSAVREGQHDFVTTALAKIAGVPAVEVRKVFSMASAKSVLALAWKCQFDIKDAVILQRDVAEIPKPKRLGENSTKEYPLSDDDLAWQYDLLFSS